MYSISELIPQRKPIIMVDEFLGIEDEVSRTQFTVCSDNIFVDNGVLSECGLIEHIAQSAAARSGYEFKEKHLPVPIGYIGAINDFTITDNPKTGDIILTEIEILQKVFNITLIRARCYVEDKEIATCRMKIFLDSNEA